MAENPVTVRAHLDEPLSRWLWLVKWLLAIPHFIILIFLWIAFFLVTIIAFFAISVHRPLPAWPVPVQRRRDAVDLASGLLHL